MKCTICSNGCDKFKRNIISDKGKIFDVYKCLYCNLIFVDPLPTIEEIRDNNTYGEDYYKSFFQDGRNYFSKEILKSEKKVVENQHDYVKNKLEGRNYLDIGCGDGKLLYLMKEKGWKGVGVEVSEMSANHGIKEYNVDIRIGTLHEYNFSNESFDFITLRHVIEHLNDPTEVIEKAYKLLKNGGIIRIDTDNCESLFNKFIFSGLIAGNNKNSIGKLYPPAHVFYFGPKSISVLLKNTGFKLMNIICPPIGSPKYFPKPNRYNGTIKEKIKQLIDDVGGIIGKGEVLVVYAQKTNQFNNG